MYKIALICPYFGKLPKEHFQLWLNSCRYNPTIDWLIFTDDQTEYNYPNNVHVEYMTFDEISELFKSKLGEDIYLDDPYKFCDYKPMYGYIFGEKLGNYDFWGHCDISDTIYGDIRKFITNDVLSNSDKILFLGHLSMYKNVPYMNELFMQDTPSSIDWKIVAQKPFVMGFDENTQYGIGIGFKMRDKGYVLHRNDSCYTDILPIRFSFSENSFDEEFHISPVLNERFICEWNQGKLFKVNVIGNKLKRTELCYVHFQKRKLDNMLSPDVEKYLIVPNKFVEYDNLDHRLVIKNSRNNCFYGQAIKLKYKNFKYRIGKKLGKTEIYK